MSEIINDYNLPQGFYEQISPYIQYDPVADCSVVGLVRLWQSALAYRKQYPDQQESIAEWTMSAGSRLSMTSDNDLFEAIHDTFGSLEVIDDKAEVAWQQLEAMIAEAVQKL